MTTPEDHPRYRSLVALDIQRSTTRTNLQKAHVRRVMYGMIHDSLRASALADHRDPLINTGDGVLVLFHPVDQAPKTLLLSALIPDLRARLTEHNLAFPDLTFRLRVVVHAGDVHLDHEGWFGEAIDVAFR